MFLEELTIPQGARLKGTSILQPKDLMALFTHDTTNMCGKKVFDEYIYAYRFSVLTGLCPEELRGITRDSIDGYQISIKQSLNSYNEITQGKNENAVRGFVMAEIAKQTLDMQLAQIPEDQQLVFDIPSMSTFLHRWKRYCISNEIQPVSLYALRHTFVSVVKNLPEGSVKALVGHSHSMNTFGVYGHKKRPEARNSSKPCLVKKPSCADVPAVLPQKPHKKWTKKGGCTLAERNFR